MTSDGTVPLTPEQHKRVRLHLAAGKVIVADTEPYLSVALYATADVVTDLVRTNAVDHRWRCYHNPWYVLVNPVREQAAVYAHLVRHLIREHHRRFEALGEPSRNQPAFNLACDVVINAEVRSMGYECPQEWTYPEDVPGARSDMTAEEVYALMPRTLVEELAGGAGEATPVLAWDGEAGGGEPGDADGDKAGTTVGDGACGSAAGGYDRAYELPPDSPEALPPGREADVVAETARAVAAAAASRPGTVPAGMVLWAKEVLEPVTDWTREFAALYRTVRATVPGVGLRTFSRPSRRASATPQFLLPGNLAPAPPTVDVIGDGSGSMTANGSRPLSRILAETEGILRAVAAAGTGIRYLSVDTETHGGAQHVTRRDDVTIRGGGGTSMTRGLADAADLRPRADVTVVVTDGQTAWPAEPLYPGHRVIAVLVGEQDPDRFPVPSWIRTVAVPD